jgi:hypothetical protein
MDDRPDCWEFFWIEVPTYTTATTHEGLRSKLAEGWEPFQVIPMTTASHWWLIFLKRRHREPAPAAPSSGPSAE